MYIELRMARFLIKKYIPLSLAAIKYLKFHPYNSYERESHGINLKFTFNTFGRIK